MTAAAKADNEPLIIGRYALFDVLASGGMATVHLGRLLGREGFGRTVAVKRLHQHFTSDPEFVTMFMDEARIVARIRHPNVVPMVDVIESPQGLFLVMEYVHGESFSRMLRTARGNNILIPIKVLASIMHGVLLGLHAAHETRGSSGELIDVVHRDVSPQNIIVGCDGVARVLDFGVAKAAGRAQVTREGQIKGKLAYMSPEQIRGKVDRRADIFACGVVLWEALAGKRLHEGARDVEIVTRIMNGAFQKPSELRPDVSPDLDAIVMRGLVADPEKRYPNAREMALELERKVGLAPASEVGPWVERLAPEAVRHRAERIEAMEKIAGTLTPAISIPPPPPPGPPGMPGSDPHLTATPYPGMTAPRLSMSDSSTTGTPIGTELPMQPPPRRRDLAPIIALVSFLAALAVIGTVLMVLSLQRRGPPPAAAGSTSASPPPPPVTAIPASASASTALPAPTVPASASAAPSAAVAPIGRPPPPGNNGGWGGAGATATATASAKTPKKNCDPPYTLDEQGHRHYKMECMEQ